MRARGSAAQRVTSENSAEQRRRGARDGLVRPLPLGLDAEVPARLLEGDLEPPAQDEPAQDLRRVAVSGRCTGRPAARTCPPGSRTSTQRIGTTGRPAWYQTAVPETISTVALAPAVPVRHADPPPGRVRLGARRSAERRQALALAAAGGRLARPARRCRLVQAGVEAQAGDDSRPCRRTAPRSSRAAKLLSATATMRRPGSQRRSCSKRLPPPVGQRLVPPAALAVVALRGGEHGQERQRPDAPRPGDGRQQHEREPAQAAGLDEVAARGAHRVAVDALGRDLRPAPALDRVVEADHDRPVRDETAHQQHAGADARAPGSTSRRG